MPFNYFFAIRVCFLILTSLTVYTTKLKKLYIYIYIYIYKVSFLQSNNN